MKELTIEEKFGDDLPNQEIILVESFAQRMDMEMVQKHIQNPVSIKGREKISILDV